MSNNHDDLKLLLGGYATGTLTPAEREKLFAAALENQEIFDALADEQALKELLDDPESRGYLREALHETTTRPLEDQPHLIRMSVAAAAAAPMPRPPSTSAVEPKRSGFRYAYPALAAVIVVGASVSAWFYLRSPEQKPVASTVTSTSQAPPQVEMAKSQPPQEFRDRREAPRQAAAPTRASSAEPVKAKDRARDEVRDQVSPAPASPSPPPAPAQIVEPVPAPVVVAAEAEAKAVVAAAPKPVPPPLYSLRRRNAQGQFVDIPPETRLTEGDEVEIILPAAVGAGAGAGGARQEVAELADVASPKKEAFANRTNALGSLARSDRAKAAAAPAPAAAASAPPRPPVPPTPANRFTLKAGENVLRYAGREIRLQAAPKNP